MLSAVRRQSAARRFLVAEAECRHWIASILGTDVLPSLSVFLSAAADGMMLLNAANRLAEKAGLAIVAPVQTTASSYKRVENINGFLDQCRALGVSEDDLFRPLDLFERKGIAAVIVTLHALANAASDRQIEPKLKRMTRVLDFSEADLSVAEASVRNVKAMQRFGPAGAFAAADQTTSDAVLGKQEPTTSDISPPHVPPRDTEPSSNTLANAVALGVILTASIAWLIQQTPLLA